MARARSRTRPRDVPAIFVDPLRYVPSPRFGELVAEGRYVVSGARTIEVRASMDQQRPYPFDGYTSLFFTPPRTATAGVQFTFGIHVTLPELAAGAPPQIADLFAEFLRRLEAHERRHVEMYRLAFPEMRNAPGPSAADALAQLREIAEHYDVQSREYDRLTENGRTEGVIWPPA